MRSSSPVPPSVVMLVEATPDIGYGHVFRTLAVASALEAKFGVEIQYVTSRDSDPRRIHSAGYSVDQTEGMVARIASSIEVPGPVLIDTYRITGVDLEALNDTGYCIAIFDDGQLPSDCRADLVIDCTARSETAIHHDGAEAISCRGPEYFPLRREFLATIRHEETMERAQHLVITFGGSDPDDLTAQVVTALSRCSEDLTATVILGPGYRGTAERETTISDRVKFVRDVADMADILAVADIAIAGAGATAFELAYLGVPSMLFTMSADQIGVANIFGQTGAAIDLGWHQQVDLAALPRTISTLVGDRPRRARMSSVGRRVVDGRGAERIACRLMAAWRRRACR